MADSEMLEGMQPYGLCEVPAPAFKVGDRVEVVGQAWTAWVKYASSLKLLPPEKTPKPAELTAFNGECEFRNNRDSCFFSNTLPSCAEQKCKHWKLLLPEPEPKPEPLMICPRLKKCRKECSGKEAHKKSTLCDNRDIHAYDSFGNPCPACIPYVPEAKIEVTDKGITIDINDIKASNRLLKPYGLHIQHTGRSDDKEKVVG